MMYSLNYCYFFGFYTYLLKKKKTNNIYKLIKFVQCDILKMYILHFFWLNTLNINNT